MNPGKGRRFGADPGRSLGDHPDKGGPIIVKNGRYGAYVSHEGVNATLPGDKTPDNVTLEEAVALIDARIAAGGGKKRKATPKKAAAGGAAPKPAKTKKTKPPEGAEVRANPVAGSKPKPQPKPRAKRATSSSVVKAKPATTVRKAPAERKRKAG